MKKLLATFLALVWACAGLSLSAGAGQPLSPGGADFVFYSASGGGGSSGARSSPGPTAPTSRASGVELPALVVPMISNGRQAGYFYLTMALEVRGDDWQVRNRVPLIQDHLVRWVYANPIPAGLSEEEALDILSEAVIAIANEIMGTEKVTGLVYRDVSTGF